MKTYYLISLLFFLFFGGIFAQCPSGSMGVSGAGCGCLSGCNLTAFGGPNCSPAVSGNCSAGYVNMVPADIVVPAGCTFTVSATMAPRAGCSASGADGSCQTCDVLKVDVTPGGVKANQQGGSNATLVDSYTLTGPGVIRVTGRANREDEIVTYSVTATTCPNCFSNLPIELVDFEALPQKSTVHLTWMTATELNNDYFTVERSRNGIDFEAIGYMDGAGTSSSLVRYSLVDANPLEGLSYYRLKQTDFDGTTDYSDVKAVLFQEELDVELYPNPANGICTLIGKHIQDAEVSLSDALGNAINIAPFVENEQLVIDTKALTNGMYFLRIGYNNEQQIKPLIVQH